MLLSEKCGHVCCYSLCEGLQLLLAQLCLLQQSLLLVQCHSLLEPSQDALQTINKPLSSVTTFSYSDVP
jgi:hypothetical protein